MIDYRNEAVVKARAKAFALLLQWAKEAEQEEVQKPQQAEQQVEVTEAGEFSMRKRVV